MNNLGFLGVNSQIQASQIGGRTNLSIIDGILMSSVVKERAKTLTHVLPEYVNSEAYQHLCKKYQASVNENIGYIFMILDKDCYKPGEIIEGRLYLEFFMPSFQTKLSIMLEGRETIP